MEEAIKMWMFFIFLILPFVQKSFQKDSIESYQSESCYDIKYSERVVGKYATYTEIMNWYAIMEARHPQVVRLIDIGTTVEGRKQVVMRLSPRPIDDLPIIFIEGTIHPREWMACAATNYLIHKMILRYKAGVSRYRKALNKYIFYFMSVANPDGYVFSFNKTNSTNRMWRKNRRQNPNGCFGVDLNRNWDVDFGRHGATKNQCNLKYTGPGPFSEPETRNMRQFMEGTIGVGRLTLYLSVHSYGQVLIVPWSYTKEKPKNYKELERAAKYTVSSIKKQTGGVYKVKNCAQFYGKASGAADDWALMHMRANYSYTFESRPSKLAVLYNSKLGLNPNSSQIPMGGQELVTAVLALVDTMNTR